MGSNLSTRFHEPLCVLFGTAGVSPATELVPRASRPQLNWDRGRPARNEREAREVVLPFAPCGAHRVLDARGALDFRLALSGNGAAAGDCGEH